MLLHDLCRQVTVQADNLAVQLPTDVYLSPCVRKLRSRLTLASKVKTSQVRIIKGRSFRSALGFS